MVADALFDDIGRRRTIFDLFRLIPHPSPFQTAT
jgi:hypothetical protein